MSGLDRSKPPPVEAGDQLGHRIATAPSGRPRGGGKRLPRGHRQQRLGVHYHRDGGRARPADPFELRPFVGGERTQRINLAA